MACFEHAVPNYSHSLSAKSTLYKPILRSHFNTQKGPPNTLNKRKKEKEKEKRKKEKGAQPISATDTIRFIFAPLELCPFSCKQRHLLVMIPTAKLWFLEWSRQHLTLYGTSHCYRQIIDDCVGETRLWLPTKALTKKTI
jgi:hypothetical protein